MIDLVIDRARIEEGYGGRFQVMHPSNDAILAYCDTQREARRVVEAIHGLANTLSYGGRKGESK